MQATLGTLLDRLQGFLGKAYLLAGFLPMVVFLTLNALLAAAVFPDATELLQDLTRLDAARNALAWLGLLLLAYVLGLLVWSLNPTIRQFLEGSYLPKPVRRWLTRSQQRELRALLERRRQFVRELFDFRRVTRGEEPWPDQLLAARKVGRERPVADISDGLRDESSRLQARRDRLDVPDFTAMERLFGLLKSELADKPADRIAKLDQLHQDFLELLDFAHQSVEVAFTGVELTSELGIRFPKNPASVGPTRLANQTEVQRDYGLRRYGLDIELYWLRLQKIARGDERFFPVLEDAKTQLDFSVTTVALLTLLTVVWVPLSLAYATTPRLFLLLAVLGPLSIWLFMQVVNQSYRAFAEAVRSAVDLYRFDLLLALHLPLPSDSAAEKAVWADLMERTVGETDKALLYLHPPPGEGKTEGKGKGEGEGDQAGEPDRAGR
jgi:hypothetical protein